MIVKTEGIKYTGSKLKLLPYIIDIAKELSPKTVLDGFSGTTRVSQAFAKLGYQVISNDIAIWSYHFANCYLLACKPLKFYQELIAYLNSLPAREGWFSANYGAAQDELNINNKKPFQIHNTQKLDAIRDEIDRLNLDEIDKSVALTSLILALDKVDNSLGHFASYLKEWSPRSYNKMVLKVPAIITSEQNHKVYSGDVFAAIKNPHDLAYFDPPYGSNNEKMPPSRVRYASYYHIWASICKNDKPALFGKANRRQDSSDTIAGSQFEEFRKDADGKFIAIAAIERLIKETNAKHIILSYSTGGRATLENLYETIKQNATLKQTLQIDYKQNVMANMKWTNDWIKSTDSVHKELIFVIKK